MAIGQQSRFWWRAMRARLRDERAELSAARTCIGPSALVCDIGAFKGSYLFWLSRWAGRVVAFEPQPDLADNLKRLAAPNVTIETKGVSSTSGKLGFHVPDGAPAGGSLRPVEGNHRQFAIDVVALDDYFPPGERLAFIKIDVEGAELEVFRGAERILTEQAPALLFECEARHHASGDVRPVFSHLAALGYTGEFVWRGRLHPLARFDPAVHQRSDGARFWDAPDYCNNFLFRRTGAG